MAELISIERERAYSNKDMTKRVILTQKTMSYLIQLPKIKFGNKYPPNWDHMVWDEIELPEDENIEKDFCPLDAYVCWLDNDFYMVVGKKNTYLFKNKTYIMTIPKFKDLRGYDHITITISPAESTISTYTCTSKDGSKINTQMGKLHVKYVCEAGFEEYNLNSFESFTFEIPEEPIHDEISEED